MRLSWRKTTLLVCCLLAAGLVGTGWWLTMTESGARWLLRSLGTTGGVKLSAGTVTGCLAKELQISGLKLEWNSEILAIDSLKLRWNPWALLQSRVDIRELTGQGIEITLGQEQPSSAEKITGGPGPDMEPLADYLPRWLKAEVKQLSIENFRIREGSEELFFFKNLTLAFSLANQVLSFQQLSWHSPYVLLDGRAHLQTRTMVLTMDAEVVLPDDLVSHGGLASWALHPSFPAKLKARGNIFAYEGEITLGNLKTQGFQLTSQALGNFSGLHLKKLYGNWLQGTIQGDLLLDWENDFFMKGELFGRDLDPAVLNSNWPGRINLDLQGELETPAQKPLRTKFAATLRPSVLLSHSLAGKAESSWDERGLVVKDLFLNGKGLQVRAKGPLSDSLNFQLDVANLADWWPESRGRIQAGGWLRWHDHYLTGEARGKGSDLAIRSINSKQTSFTARHDERGGPMEVRLSAQRIAFGDLVFKKGELVATGTPEKHVVDFRLGDASGIADLRGHLKASFQKETWDATLESFRGHSPHLGRWTLADPVKLSLGQEGLGFSPVILEEQHGGVLRLIGDFRTKTGDGYLQGRWHNLSLPPFSHWLPAGKLWGQSIGNLTVRWLKDQPQLLEGHIQASGGLSVENRKVSFEQAALDLIWQNKGLEGSLRMDLGQSGKLNLVASSTEPVYWGEPRNCHINIGLHSLDLSLLRAFFPQKVPFKGHLFAEAKGEWLTNRRFTWQGQAHIEEGSLGWKTLEPVQGAIVANIEDAQFSWNWQKESLKTGLLLVMDQGGRLKGEIDVPISAQWPLDVRDNGALKGKINAAMGEWGILTALFPDLIRETRGQVGADISLAGTWKDPLLEGHLALEKMGGYLPNIGVQLDDVNLTATFQGQKAIIEKLVMHSGPGRLEGDGTLEILQGGDFNYQLKLKGKNFQLANLPNLQILSEPDVLIQGDARRFSLSGEILLSDLKISGTGKTPEIQASRDVVIIRPEETEAEAKSASDFDLDIGVKILLGRKVFVETAGLNAQLEGDMMLLQKEVDKPLAKGQIRVVDGSYTAYGAKLNVKRGHINFTGGPADNPNLDILALREIGKIRAGVRVTGTAELPEVNLYSRPAMPEKDIIGYIFLGRPIRSEQQESDMLALGAGALLPQGPGFFRRLGFTDVDLGGLFSEGGAVRLRYRLRENLEVESTLGNTSGVDIFHVIEFE